MIGQYSTREDAMPAITPFLWFNDNAYEAAQFYLSLFPNSSITEHQQKPDGTTFTLKMMLDGREFQALNGGPYMTMNSGVSFMIHCKDQAEVDHYYDAFAAGGTEQACGWIVDRFGVTWQVVPQQLFEALSNPDPAKAQRANEAMMGMKKLIVADLLNA
jgi:predicted 3-demethylubiquinone-9 3-methyltransferase (glyoxalase superfamily)